MPEDKLVFIIQIMQGVNSLYNSGAVESKKMLFTNGANKKKEMFRMTMLNWHLIERKINACIAAHSVSNMFLFKKDI